MERLLAARKTFVAETVFANESYLRIAQRAKALGYHVQLFFVGVRAVEDSTSLVAARVAKGGHNVREADIRRRWPLCHANLARMVPIADRVLVFSNAGYGQPPRLVTRAIAGRVTLFDADVLPAVTEALAPLLN